MKRGLRQSMPNVPIPVADTSGHPVTSQVQPKLAPPPPPPPPTWTSGTIRETCSCGASIEVPATSDGRETLAEWRHMHRHTPATEQVDNPQPKSQDAHATTGEIRESSQQDVPFGFFPPVVEARQP